VKDAVSKGAKILAVLSLSLSHPLPALCSHET
jgi:hypothetical protein